MRMWIPAAALSISLLPSLMQSETVSKHIDVLFFFLTRAHPLQINVSSNEVILVPQMKMETADHEGILWAIKLTAHHGKYEKQPDFSAIVCSKAILDQQLHQANKAILM